jgi:hypothetical protein
VQPHLISDVLVRVTRGRRAGAAAAGAPTSVLRSGAGGQRAVRSGDRACRRRARGDFGSPSPVERPGDGVVAVDDGTRRDPRGRRGARLAPGAVRRRSCARATAATWGSSIRRGSARPRGPSAIAAAAGSVVDRLLAARVAVLVVR